MKRILSICSLLLVAFFSGCFYDKAELVYPNTGINNCDTTLVRYSVEITGILSANCYVCHGGNAVDGAGLKLDTYNGVKNMVNNGILLRAINHSPGTSAMPKGGSKLPDCTIAKITAWINNGAPQN